MAEHRDRELKRARSEYALNGSCKAIAAKALLVSRVTILRDVVDYGHENVYKMDKNRKNQVLTRPMTDSLMY